MVIYGVSVFSKKTTSSAAADFTVPDLVEKDKTKEEYNNRLKKANSYQRHKKNRIYPRQLILKLTSQILKMLKEKRGNNDNQATKQARQRQEPIQAKEDVKQKQKVILHRRKKKIPEVWNCCFRSFW